MPLPPRKAALTVRRLDFPAAGADLVIDAKAGLGVPPGPLDAVAAAPLAA